MTMHSFALTQGRLNKYKGEILSHAVPQEVISKQGRQVSMPKNQSDTYVARRFLPYGASATDANTINNSGSDQTGATGCFQQLAVVGATADLRVLGRFTGLYGNATV